MLASKDLLGLRELSKEEIMEILNRAAELKPMVKDNKLRGDLLNQKSVITVFYENSTRTKMSFDAAAQYLGAYTSDLGVGTSSVKKGETLVDTGVTLDQMGYNAIIMRHGMTAAPHLLAKNVNASVINAGDGSNEHPTQALLDLFTIREKIGYFEGLKVAIIGDIAHSRVARSNIFGLTKLGAKVTLAGPSTLVSKAYEKLGVKVTNNVMEAVEGADVVMGLRVQLERQKGGLFPDLREYASLFGVNEKVLAKAQPDAIVMHPAPVNRGVEMTTMVIDGEQSVINEQVTNGVAVRMAILDLLLNRRQLQER